MLHLFKMISSSFDLLRSHSYLVVELRFSIIEVLSFIERLANCLEVSLNQVKVVFILLFLSSGVFEEENSKLVETFSHFLTL